MITADASRPKTAGRSRAKGEAKAPRRRAAAVIWTLDRRASAAVRAGALAPILGGLAVNLSNLPRGGALAMKIDAKWRRCMFTGQTVKQRLL